MKSTVSLRPIAAGVLALIIAPCWPLASAAANERSHDTDLRAPLSQGDTFEIRGIAGSVVVTQASGAEATIHAHATARTADPASVKIEMARTGNRVVVCADYHGGNCAPGRDLHTSGSHDEADDVTVDFTIAIPRGVALVAGTVDGNVTVHDVDGNVTAHTVNGNVKIATSGLADAHTVSGSIDATFGRLASNDDVTFETISGPIHVTVPHDADASISAKTLSGPIEGDAGVGLVLEKGSFVGETGTAKLRDGAARVSLHTVSGSIRVSRS